MVDRTNLSRSDKAALRAEARHRTSGPAMQKTPTNQNPQGARVIREQREGNRPAEVDEIDEIDEVRDEQPEIVAVNGPDADHSNEDEVRDGLPEIEPVNEGVDTTPDGGPGVQTDDEPKTVIVGDGDEPDEPPALETRADEL